MDKEFQGKTALVTGAASGIGRLTAQCLALQGANVLMLDVNDEALNTAAAEIRDLGGSVSTMVCDVRSYEQICAARDKALSEYGQIDITVSVAGGHPARMCRDSGKCFEEWSVETLNWGVEVNFRAPMYMAHAVMAHMKQRKTGVLIQIGSIVGETGSAGGVDYSAEKSGLMYGLTKSLALEGAPFGVRANCVTPGPVLTRPDMAKMKTPLGRAAQPQEIVDMILYLCSDKAAFITGANFLVDGGRACGGLA